MEESGLVEKNRVEGIKNEVNEIIAIVVASIKTLKNKPK